MTPSPTPYSAEDTQALALRLSAVATIATLTLALYARSLDLLRTDVPLRSSNGRLFWVVTIVVVIGCGVIVQRFSERLTVSGPSHQAQTTFAAGGGAVLPALAMFAALQLVAWDSRSVVMIAAPLLAGVGVFTSVIVRYYLHSADPAVQPGARLVQLALTAGVGFLSLALARNWMGGPAYTFIACMLLGGLLLYQASDGLRTFHIRRVAYALAGGAVVGEAAMALSYWPLTGWYAGAFLAVVFVVLMLSVDSILSRNVSTDVIARYLGAGVGVCGLLVLLAR